MKVAIVNDMFTAVECLRRSLIYGGHDIAWVARNGEEALSLCMSNPPDLVLMDLYMPVMDGVEATSRIMERAPCPIVIVTSSVDEHAGRAFEAMGRGALDAVNTPVCGAGNNVVGASDLLEKICTIERLIKHDEGGREVANIQESKQISHHAVPLVVIGASSGGPQALTEILSKMPEDLNAAIVIVQHVDAHFAGELALWLNEFCSLNVRTAVEGGRPRVGDVLIAQTNDHLRLNQTGCFIYTEAPEDMVYRPSVDVFFASVAENWKGPVLGVLLTGMGRDGALGLLELRKMGVFTIAQNEESCAVFGMPKAAMDLDAAVRLYTPEEIAREIIVWQPVSVDLDGELA